MDVKIIKNGDYVGTDEGRLYLDGYSLIWVCDKCGCKYDRVMNRDCYFYDCIISGEADRFSLWCSECDNEVDIKLRLSIGLELVE